MRGKLLAHAGLDRPEVLADHRRARALTLQRDDGQQFLGGIAHIGAVGRRQPVGDPEEAEESHDVVDAQAAAMVERGADRLDERSVAERAQPVWDERRQSPVLAAGHEAIGRGADRGAGGQRVLPGPGVGPVGVHADRQVLHDSDLDGGGLELPLEEPLQPLVKAHARGVRLREARDVRRVGTAVLRRPRVPAATVALGQHAKGRELAKACTAFSNPTLEVRAGRRALRPQPLQRLHLEVEYPRAVDHALGAEGAAQRRQPLELGAERRGLRHVLDPEIERVHEAAARRVIGARLLRAKGQRRDERIYQYRARAQAGGPAAERSQVGKVADAPGVRRARRIELRRPAPAATRRYRTAARAHDQPDRRAVVARPKLVIARRDVDRKRAVEVARGAVLQHESRARGHLDPLAGAPHDDRRGRRRLTLGAHGTQEGFAGGGRRRTPFPERIVIAVRDAPGVRHL